MVQTLLTRLTAMIAKPRRVERRRSRRLSPAQRTPCQFLVSEGSLEGEALLHDISLLGAGILSECRIEPGAIVQLLLVNASHTCALTLEYEVVRCTRSAAGTFFLGGRFRRPLSHDELAPFLI